MNNLFDKEDVFSWATCEEASTYIDKKGYFGDSLEELKEQIKEHNLKKLLWIDDSNVICFHPEKQTVTELNMAFFLSEDKVKHLEKKWRPFKDYAEFIRTVGCDLGDRLAIRRKGIPIVHRVLIIEFHEGLNTLNLGSHTCCYRELFEEYEWQDKEGNWQPFGVEE